MGNFRANFSPAARKERVQQEKRENNLTNLTTRKPSLDVAPTILTQRTRKTDNQPVINYARSFLSYPSEDFPFTVTQLQLSHRFFCCISVMFQFCTREICKEIYYFPVLFFLLSSQRLRRSRDVVNRTSLATSMVHRTCRSTNLAVVSTHAVKRSRRLIMTTFMLQTMSGDWNLQDWKMTDRKMTEQNKSKRIYCIRRKTLM